MFDEVKVMKKYYLGGKRSGALKQESSKISLLALGDIVAAVFAVIFSSSTHTDDCSFSFIPSIALNFSEFLLDDPVLQPKHSK